MIVLIFDIMLEADILIHIVHVTVSLSLLMV